MQAAIPALAGVRAGICATPTPIPMRSVCAAIHVASTIASEPQVSEAHTESRPRRSASRASGTTSCGVPSQWRTWIPMRTGEG